MSDLGLLLPLMFLWGINNRSATATQVLPRKTAAPKWPTPNSPPPPIRAFKARATPSADPSHSSTPLADLHNAPPTLSAPTTDPTVKEAPHLSTPQAAKQAAINAFKKKASQQLKQRATSASLSSLFRGGSSTTEVSVASLQQILNKRGATLKQDGLYGPKTAAAWKKAASAKQVPSNITRASSRTAKVAKQAYDALSVPAIP